MFRSWGAKSLATVAVAVAVCLQPNVTHAAGPGLDSFVALDEGCSIYSDQCIYFGAGSGQHNNSTSDPAIKTVNISSGLFDLTPGVIDRSNAAAFATYGRIGASADAAVDNTPAMGSSTRVGRSEVARASAQFTDRLVFSGGAGSGDLLNLRIALPLDGVAIGQAFPTNSRAFAEADWGMGIGLTRDHIFGDPAGADYFTWRFDGYSDDANYLITTIVNNSRTGHRTENQATVSYADAPLSAISVSLPVETGRTYSLFMSIGTGVDVSVRGWDPDVLYQHAAGSSNFFHTATWGGVIEATDSAGAPVTNLTVTSWSGVDYAQSQAVAAVPEPSSYALMMAGLCLIGWVVRPSFRRGERKLSKLCEISVDAQFQGSSNLARDDHRFRVDPVIALVSKHAQIEFSHGFSQ